jgi:hypothetical protein
MKSAQSVALIYNPRRLDSRISDQRYRLMGVKDQIGKYGVFGMLIHKAREMHPGRVDCWRGDPYERPLAVSSVSAFAPG